MLLLWLDTETTGSLRTDYLRQLTYALEGPVLGDFKTMNFKNPNGPTYPGQISYEIASRRIVRHMKQFLRGCGYDDAPDGHRFYLAGWNIGFDRMQLKKRLFSEFDEFWQYICPDLLDVMQVAKQKTRLAGYTLDYVANHFQLPHRGHWNNGKRIPGNSRSDIIVTRQIYKILCKQIFGE